MSASRWMDVALALGRRGLGTTAPNPAVGCVIVKDEQIVGRGWTQPGGRPHAETEALRRAGAAAAGASAYVTLEPCSHHGKTPPCCDALIEAGVRQIFVAQVDPNPRVAGQGLARLEAAGRRVVQGLGADEAMEDLSGYLNRRNAGWPRVTLKLATSLDGKIATATGDSRWITGEAARRRGHALRATHDAILIGGETAMADDPVLTCRLQGVYRPYPRIVLDSRARLTPESALVRSAAGHPVWQIISSQSESLVADREGVIVIALPPEENSRPSARSVLAELGERGINDLLVEGGGAVAASFLKADRVDRLFWFRAGKILGNDARAGVAGLGLAKLEGALDWRLLSSERCGDDRLDLWQRVPG